MHIRALHTCMQACKYCQKCKLQMNGMCLMEANATISLSDLLD